ncbi:MAG: glyoxalase superfamily protein [Parasphingorhabdus sp.]|nr:glyoxalase superfamily protein [Parasphingorhabdus sp.]
MDEIDMNSSRQDSLSLKELKQQARRLRSDIAQDAAPISHSKSLEMVAHQRGFKDWNTLHASASNRPDFEKLSLGDTVTGRYLGQSFRGEVVAIRTIKLGQLYHISIQLEQAIDVVTFESFSNFRRRLNCSVDHRGVSPAKTSNGEPHMILEL